MSAVGSISETKRETHEPASDSKGETATGKAENITVADKAAHITAKATIWIAVFTVVLAVVGIGTVVVALMGGIDTHKMAEVAVIQNRPWIGFEPGGMRSDAVVIDNRGWVTTIVSDTIKNFGNVPGLIPAAPGSVSAHLVIADVAQGNDVVVRQLREFMASQLPRGEGMSATIFPGMTNNYTNTAGVPPERMIPNRNAPELEAYLVGGIIYTDPVGKVVHHTAFSYLYWSPPFRGVLIVPTPGTTVPTGIWVEYRTLVD